MTAKNLVKLITKQEKPIIWIGALRNMLTRTQAYYGLLNLPLQIIILFSVRAEDVQRYIPWVTVPILIGMFIICVIIVSIIDWKWIYPATVAHAQNQEWKHQSWARQIIEEQGEKIDKLTQLIEKIQESNKL
jgi:hypothetical protein